MTGVYSCGILNIRQLIDTGSVGIDISHDHQNCLQKANKRLQDFCECQAILFEKIMLLRRFLSVIDTMK